MDVEAPGGLLRAFEEVEDHRRDRTKLHELSDILVVTLCAVICGADEWTEIELFGKAKFDWLKRFLKLPHGIPSHNTFGRVFSLLDPEQLERCFLTWVQALTTAAQGGLHASADRLRRTYPHLVHAFSGRTVVCVAAEAVAPPFQFLVQVVQQHVRQERRQRAPLRRPFVSLDAYPFVHHPRLKEAANDREQAFVSDTPGRSGHQDVVADSVEGTHDTLPTSRLFPHESRSFVRVIRCTERC